MLFEQTSDLTQDRDMVVRRSYGMIETQDEAFQALHFRPWPKLISGIEVAWIGGWKHKRDRRNRCTLYYNQPIAHRNYLVLSYIQSTLGTSFATVRLSMRILDQIAAIKKSDAILFELTNERVPARLLERWGWERHLIKSRKQHWIKRFYGDYSDIDSVNKKLVNK